MTQGAFLFVYMALPAMSMQAESTIPQINLTRHNVQTGILFSIWLLANSVNERVWVR